jgi:hypothetical protein
MSPQDPRQAPRRRKFVLRKIADGPAGTPVEARPAGSAARTFAASTADSAARAVVASDSAVPAMPIAARNSSGTRIAAAPSDSSGRIGDSAARTPPAAPSSSYSGPLSNLRQSPQTPMPMRARQSSKAFWEAENAPVEAPARLELEPEEVEEAPEEAELLNETPSRDVQAMETWAAASDGNDWHASEAGTAAAMTPRAPSPVPTAVRSTPAWSAVPAGLSQPAQPHASAPERTPSFPPARGAAPGFPRDTSPRTSVAPVVASLLPPMDTGPQLAPPRRRLSADSKLLAAGGALAAAMLLVALGVLLGQRSASPETSSAAASGQYPLVVATKAPAAKALPAAAPVAEARPAVAAAAPEKSEGPATIDVQQLPAAPRPRPQGWSVAPTAPRAAAGAGWSVAATPAAHPAPAKTVDPNTQAAAADPSPTAVASGAASGSEATPTEAPAASVSATPPVDPLVQAVREDIREDEARTK